MWWALGHALDPGAAFWPLSLLLALNVALLVSALAERGAGIAWWLSRACALLLVSTSVLWWVSLHLQAGAVLPLAVWAGLMFPQRMTGVSRGWEGH